MEVAASLAIPEDSLDAMPGAESNVQEGGYSSNQVEKLKEHIDAYINEEEKYWKFVRGVSGASEDT